MKRRTPPQHFSPEELAYLEDIRGWVYSAQIDRVASYTKRGREFRSLPNQELVDRWCAAYRSLADEPTSGTLARLAEDLEAELGLRSINPPIERILAEIERFGAAVNERFEELKKDSAAFEESGERCRRDFETFVAARDKPKN